MTKAANAKEVSVSVVIPTYRRSEKLLDVLSRIASASPQPAEILVHIDNDDDETEARVRAHFPDVRVIASQRRVGPGGGRNRLVAEARCLIAVSFDDDSYPIDEDFFAVVVQTFETFPEAAVIAAEIIHDGDVRMPRSAARAWVSDFVGCGCAYRRSAFLETHGYVPLPLAYGMEEVDLSLRLHDHGWRVLKSGELRVRHATRLRHHADTAVTHASIANLALLTYLRYPPCFWLFGAGQVLNRVLWLLRHHRWSGVVSGLAAIPTHLWRYRQFRAVVAPQTLQALLALRRKPRSVEIDRS